MQAHRSTQARVSNDPQLSNFEPGTALENLRAEMIDIEALARAAEAAADGLPTPTTDRQRLAFGRIQSLATKTSQQASASLASPTYRSPRSPRTWRRSATRPRVDRRERARPGRRALSSPHDEPGQTSQPVSLRNPGMKIPNGAS